MAKSRLRSINTSIWDDPWIMDLTPTEKLIWIYLLTNEKTNMLGVYQLTIRKISFDTGLEESAINTILKRFEKDKKIIYQDHYLIIINWAKHQSYNKNMMKSAEDLFIGLKPEIKNLIPIEVTNYLKEEKQRLNYLKEG